MVRDYSFHMKGLDYKFGATVYMREGEVDESSDDDRWNKGDDKWNKDRWNKDDDERWNKDDDDNGRWNKDNGRWKGGKWKGGRRRLVDELECGSDVVAHVVADEEYGAVGDQCSEFCTPAFALQ